MTCWQKQQTSTICQSQAEGRGGTEFALPHVCEGQKYHMTNRVNRFRMFAKRVALTLDKALVAVMALLSSHNLLSLKSRDSYTVNGSVDEIQIMYHCYEVNGVKVLLQAI